MLIKPTTKLDIMCHDTGQKLNTVQGLITNERLLVIRQLSFKKITKLTET